MSISLTSCQRRCVHFRIDCSSILQRWLHYEATEAGRFDTPLSPTHSTHSTHSTPKRRRQLSLPTSTSQPATEISVTILPYYHTTLPRLDTYGKPNLQPHDFNVQITRPHHVHGQILRGRVHEDSPRHNCSCACVSEDMRGLETRRTA